MEEKIDIVIQGAYTSYTDFIADSYLELPFVNNVIISCWEDNKLPREKRRIKYVRSKYPVSPGTDNKNLQIVSSLNGLKKCETKFAVKTRSDQKFTYDSMMKMYDFFLENNERNLHYQYNHKKPFNRILAAGMFPDVLFAVRDHIFWGNTDDLIELFDIPLEQNSLIDKVKIPKERLGNYYDHFIRTETYIGAHYCANFEEEIFRFLLLPEKHLYDGAEYWYYVKELSNRITTEVFKSFPKTAIDLEWQKCQSLNFAFSLEQYKIKSFWHEEGC